MRVSNFSGKTVGLCKRETLENLEKQTLSVRFVSLNVDFSIFDSASFLLKFHSVQKNSMGPLISKRHIFFRIKMM